MPPPTGGGQALDQVKLPAIFLIVTGAIGILGALISVVQSATGMNEAQLQELMDNPEIPEQAKQFIEMSSSGGIVLNLIALATAAFVIYAGMKMMRLEKFGLSMAGSIIAMIPCLGPCCCIGLPVGIWSLIVLNKPEVKSAFTS